MLSVMPYAVWRLLWNIMGLKDLVTEVEPNGKISTNLYTIIFINLLNILTIRIFGKINPLSRTARTPCWA